jgi:hypothetical protein
MATTIYSSTSYEEIEFYVNKDEKVILSHDLELDEAQKLKMRFGFIPQARVIFDIGYKQVCEAAIRMVKDGLCMAVFGDRDALEDKCKMIPSDLKDKTNLVKLAMQKSLKDWKENDASLALLIYSNNPDKIRKMPPNSPLLGGII